MLRTLIVDDEPLARERLRRMLGRERDVEVVAECRNAREAARSIRRLQPDLVLLDVQMPGADGFEVLTSMAPARPPALVFVTAYDEYAVRAFAVRALDYLLKPVTRSRLHEAVERARARAASRGAQELHSRIGELLDQIGAQGGRPDRLVLKEGERIGLLPTEVVDWVAAEGNYVRIHHEGQSHLLRETMRGLEAKLDPRRFVRLHRETLVNLERVKEIQPLFKGQYGVVLHDGTRLTLSRRYRRRLERRLGARF